MGHLTALAKRRRTTNKTFYIHRCLCRMSDRCRDGEKDGFSVRHAVGQRRLQPANELQNDPIETEANSQLRFDRRSPLDTMVNRFEFALYLFSFSPAVQVYTKSDTISWKAVHLRGRYGSSSRHKLGRIIARSVRSQGPWGTAQHLITAGADLHTSIVRIASSLICSASAPVASVVATVSMPERRAMAWRITSSVDAPSAQ